MQLQYQIAYFYFNTEFHEKTNRETGKNKPSGVKKIFRIALAVLGKQNASSTIPLTLTLFCTKFLQVF